MKQTLHGGQARLLFRSGLKVRVPDRVSLGRDKTPVACLPLSPLAGDAAAGCTRT